MTGYLHDGMGEQDVVRLLDLAPHPEGGWYRETFRDERCDASGRSASSLIYFLLGAGDVSAWHRVDAVEVWHWYAGAPLVLTVSANGHDAEAPIWDRTCGQASAPSSSSRPTGGRRPQASAAGRWSAARSPRPFSFRPSNWHPRTGGPDQEAEHVGNANLTQFGHF